ncbi:MAG: alpha/beta fold hydrolase [Planctomycetaceae bacterium]|nr:alpha/beta fold hydrolase [Planctomycetaceae bacterium]
MSLANVLLVAAGALLVFDLIVRTICGRLVLRHFERKIPFAVEQATPNLSAERIEFPSADGLTLRGSLLRHTDQKPRGLVIFCPELEGSHWSANNYAAGLFAGGYDVLSFDFRNQGESDSTPGYEPMHWLTEYEVSDVLSAIRYARSRADIASLPIGLFGISRGGGAALAAAIRTPDVQVVACEGAYSTESLMLHYVLRWASLYVPAWVMRRLPIWHVRGTLVLVRWFSGWRKRVRHVTIERSLPVLSDRSILMIAGGRDTYVTPQITEILAKRVDPTRELLWVVPAARHNEARHVDQAGYDERLLEAFRRLETPVPDRFPRLLHVA